MKDKLFAYTRQEIIEIMEKFEISPIAQKEIIEEVNHLCNMHEAYIKGVVEGVKVSHNESHKN